MREGRVGTGQHQPPSFAGYGKTGSGANQTEWRMLLSKPGVRRVEERARQEHLELRVLPRYQGSPAYAYLLGCMPLLRVFARALAPRCIQAAGRVRSWPARKWVVHVYSTCGRKAGCERARQLASYNQGATPQRRHTRESAWTRIQAYKKRHLSGHATYIKVTCFFSLEECTREEKREQK